MWGLSSDFPGPFTNPSHPYLGPLISLRVQPMESICGIWGQEQRKVGILIVHSPCRDVIGRLCPLQRDTAPIRLSSTAPISFLSLPLDPEQHPIMARSLFSPHPNWFPTPAHTRLLSDPFFVPSSKDLVCSAISSPPGPRRT